ncbi:MAG: GNAT family N-acetyltransferase [Alphaproteobacteria bacterium]|nr:GNAT family N-acetyltransferase [Alphaproteobacteria bacterium]
MPRYAVCFFAFFFFLWPCLQLHGMEESSSEDIYQKASVHYYALEPNVHLSKAFLDQATKMYYDCYDPDLHKDYTLEAMGINASCFQTYEEFLNDLIQTDFHSYNTKTCFVIYATEGDARPDFSNLVGLCVTLPEKEKGHYYIDHIGVKKGYQGNGIGRDIISILEKTLPDLQMISLDTRVFIMPGQKLYAKSGFKRIEPHPVPMKQGKYIFYQKTF